MRAGTFARWVGLVLVTGACGTASEAANEPAPAVAAAPAPQTPAAAMLAGIRDDAVRRSGLPEQELTIGPALSVTWPDGSLGCPEPGRLYTQALVPGWRVEVRAGGRTLDYHANQHGAWFFCPAQRVRKPAPDSRL